MSARAIVGGAAVLLALAAGCEPFPPPEHSPSVRASTPSASAPTTARPDPPSRDEVETMLLTTADLPAGYVATPAGTNPASGMGPSLHDCGSARSSPSPGTARVDALAVFQQGVTMFVAEGLTVTDEATARRTIEGLATVTRDCGAFSGVGGPGLDISVTLAQLTFPPVGDGSAAFRMTGSLGGVATAIFAHVVAVRHRDVVITVTVMGMRDPDVATTGAIVRSALAKVRARR